MRTANPPPQCKHPGKEEVLHYRSSDINWNQVGVWGWGKGEFPNYTERFCKVGPTQKRNEASI